MSDDDTAPTCYKCGQKDAGPGGILCPECFQLIGARGGLGATSTSPAATAPCEDSATP